MKFLIYLYTLFIIYSLLGYICEMLFVAILDKEFKPRGFLWIRFYIYPWYAFKIEK